MDPVESVQYAFRHVGVAIWVTSAVLIAGFFILSLSAFELNASMGLMTGMIIAIAMILEFFLLAPLLMFFDKSATIHKAEIHT